MKPHTLPVKRRPAPKGILKRLSAVTRSRKQRVAATAGAEMEVEDSGSKISRALTIIFLFHIVAIGLIFVHKQFLDGRPSELTEAKAAEKNSLPIAAATLPRDLPRVTQRDKTHVVVAGDNYARIASDEGVDEGELRLVNKHIPISPGTLLIVPPKRIVAVESPEVTAIREKVPPIRDQGLVEVDVSNAPRAQLIRPNIHPAAVAPKATLAPRPATPVSNSTAPVAASGKTYVVQQGDSVWRIANRLKVNQDQLMRANGIGDARKIKPGMSLSIPK
jgi:LysM repeat protein